VSWILLRNAQPTGEEEKDMKYFTRERYLAMQDCTEAAMDAADADWENAVERYDAYLQTIRAEMPECVRQLLDGFYLHDARVLSMGQRGDRFDISVQLDVPPNDLLHITYALTGSPEVTESTFPWAKESHPVDWLYEEMEWLREEDRNRFVHSILFSNGWEIRLPFRAVQTATAFPILPHPRSAKSAEGALATSQSA